LTIDSYRIHPVPHGRLSSRLNGDQMWNYLDQHARRHGYDQVFTYSLFKEDRAAFLLVITYPLNQQSRRRRRRTDDTSSSKDKSKFSDLKDAFVTTVISRAPEFGGQVSSLFGPRLCTSPRSAFLYCRSCIICSYFS
jgi:hypothetical protein